MFNVLHSTIYVSAVREIRVCVCVHLCIELMRDVILKFWLLAIIVSSLTELISFNFERYVEYGISHRETEMEREDERDGNERIECTIRVLCLSSVILTFVFVCERVPVLHLAPWPGHHALCCPI